MHTQLPIDFRVTLVAKHPERLAQIRSLLVDSGLGMDSDITLFVEAWADTAPRHFPNYSAGSEGPSAANDLLARDGRAWRTIK